MKISFVIFSLFLFCCKPSNGQNNYFLLSHSLDSQGIKQNKITSVEKILLPIVDSDSNKYSMRYEFDTSGNIILLEYFENSLLIFKNTYGYDKFNTLLFEIRTSKSNSCVDSIIYFPIYNENKLVNIISSDSLIKIIFNYNDKKRLISKSYLINEKVRSYNQLFGGCKDLISNYSDPFPLRINYSYYNNGEIKTETTLFNDINKSLNKIEKYFYLKNNTIKKIVYTDNSKTDCDTILYFRDKNELLLKEEGENYFINFINDENGNRILEEYYEKIDKKFELGPEQLIFKMSYQYELR